MSRAPYRFDFFRWRERRMYLLVALFERVRAPLVGLPHGVTGCRPPRGAALAAAVRVVDRVHHHAADARADALEAVAAGLADVLVRVVGVRHRADRRHALLPHQAQLARRQPDLRVAAVAADELGVGAGRAGDLAALARLHLDVVHDRADRHRRERHGVARLDVGLGRRDHRVADREPLRRQDVGLLAVGIADQRDERGPVRVVLDPDDLGRRRRASFRLKSTTR